MHRPQEQVRELHRGINHPTSPAEPKVRNAKLRAKLILEEAAETIVALVGSEEAVNMLGLLFDAVREAHRAQPRGPEFFETIDGLTDLLVVTYGTAEDIGIDIEPFFDETHAANMRKLDGPVREDGKRMKPPGWVGPDHEKVMKWVLRRREVYEGMDETARSYAFACMACGFPVPAGVSGCRSCTTHPEIRFDAVRS